MYSDTPHNIFSLINPLDLTCQAQQDDTVQGLILLPYSSLTINNSDKIPFKIGHSGELILAHLAYKHLYQHDETKLHEIKVEMQENLSNLRSDILNRKLKDIKNEMDNDSNLEESIKNKVSENVEFLKSFKKRRMDWRLYQSQITSSLCQYNSFPKLSQSYLSRLEKLDVTFRSAQNVISYLEIWLKNSEELFDLYKMKYCECNEFDVLSLDSESLSKFHKYILNHSHFLCTQIKRGPCVLQRKKRTVFSKPLLQKLTTIFSTNQFPKSINIYHFLIENIVGEEIQSIASNFNVNLESVMQWFSNQRRKLDKVVKT